MWKVFSVESKQYFIHTKYENESLVIRLTDLVKCWKEFLLKETITERFKELNSIEGHCEVTNVINCIQKDLDPQCEHVSKTVKIEKDKCFLNFISNEKEFSFNFTLSINSTEEFYKDITLPLLLIIQELYQRQENLKRLLKEKDEEITEYQLEGAKLFRRYLKTKTFDDSEFLDECSKIAESTLTSTIGNISKVFNPEINALYLTAVRASENYIENRGSDAIDESSAGNSSALPDCDPKMKKLKWELGPQKVKRFKTKRTKINL